MNDEANAKIRMLKDSLNCFVFGLLGLLPLIGIPFAIVALLMSGVVRRSEKRYWNAAQPYRIWGVACAAFGLVFWFLIASLIVGNAIINSDGSGDGWSGGGGE